MAISVVSSVSSGTSLPRLSGISSVDTTLPVDFAAMLGEQLLAANPNLLTENTGQQALAFSKDVSLDLDAQGLSEASALDAEQQAELATQNPEFTGEIATLDPSIAAQLGNPALAGQIQLPPQKNTENPLNLAVDRRISLISEATGKQLDALSGKQGNNALGDALLRDINAATRNNPLQTTIDPSNKPGNFADSLIRAGNKLGEGSNISNPLIPTSANSNTFSIPATLNNEISQQSFADSANFAADLTKTTSETPALTGSVSTNPLPGPAQNTPQATTEIATPLNDTHWSNEFSEKIVWVAKNEHQTAQININPPELGPMQIRLNLNGDQATAVFASQHAEVRQAIEEAMPRLREMLSSSGISLGEANVGTQLPQQNREQAPQFTNSKPNETRLTGENAILAGDLSAKTGAGSVPIHRGRGLVDLFA